MDAEKIIGAAKTIQKHQEAQAYLEALKEASILKEEFSLDINFGGQVKGHFAGVEIIRAFAFLELPALIETGLKNCVNTIEIHKDTIRREIGIETGT